MIPTAAAKSLLQARVLSETDTRRPPAEVLLPQEASDSSDGRDPDDFAIMSEIQAKRIVSLSEMAFEVELSADVVIADANVGALARRVMGARSLKEGSKKGG